MDTHFARPALPSAPCLGLCLALLLSACGGNNSGDNGGPTTGNPSAANVNAEGAWSGSNSLGNAFDLLLENGELHQVFGTVSAGVFTPLGLDWGHYAVSGSTLTSPITQYNPNGSKATGSLSATVVAATSINGSAGSDVNSSRVDFVAAPSSVSHAGYSYNTPAQLADIAGPWLGSLVLGQSGSFTLSVDANTGTLAGTNLGCTFSGSLTPRASGKNVFNLNLTMGPAPCAAAGQAYAGVAISYRTTTGKRQLVGTLQSPDKTLGSVLYGLR